MKKSETIERPWGKYTVIGNDINYKLKRIEVNPGHRLSYQYHTKRSEVWTVIQGKGVVTIDGEKREVSYGECVKIDIGSKHRIKNHTESTLVFIEVQTGTYFGEDDIVRIEDDYNRVK
tara:strand:- start:59 stop:412 length:354 start_codon:yes stop_codon:yes gene_type:complete